MGQIKETKEIRGRNVRGIFLFYIILNRWPQTSPSQFYMRQKGMDMWVSKVIFHPIDHRICTWYCRFDVNRFYFFFMLVECLELINMHALFQPHLLRTIRNWIYLCMINIYCPQKFQGTCNHSSFSFLMIPMLYTLDQIYS